MKQGEARREQVAKIARDLVDWSRQNSERLLEVVRREVKKQMSRAGVATKDDVESLKRRVRELEKKTSSRKSPSARKSPSTRKSSASKG